MEPKYSRTYEFKLMMKFNYNLSITIKVAKRMRFIYSFQCQKLRMPYFKVKICVLKFIILPVIVICVSTLKNIFEPGKEP